MEKFKEIVVTKTLSISIGLVLSFLKDAIFFKPFPQINVINILILLSIVLVLVDVRLITEVVIEDSMLMRIFFLIIECMFYIELGLIFIWPKIAELIGSLAGIQIISVFSKFGLPSGTIIAVLKYAMAIFIFGCVLKSSDSYKIWKNRIKLMYLKRKSQRAMTEAAEGPQQYCFCPALTKIQMQLREMDQLCEPRTSRRRTNPLSTNHS